MAVWHNAVVRTTVLATRVCGVWTRVVYNLRCIQGSVVLFIVLITVSTSLLLALLRATGSSLSHASVTCTQQSNDFRQY